MTKLWRGRTGDEPHRQFAAAVLGVQFWEGVGMTQSWGLDCVEEAVNLTDVLAGGAHGLAQEVVAVAGGNGFAGAGVGHWGVEPADTDVAAPAEGIDKFAAIGAHGKNGHGGNRIESRERDKIPARKKNWAAKLSTLWLDFTLLLRINGMAAVQF